MSHIPLENSGKGDTPRYRTKEEKEQADETWLRCFGDECSDCYGTGRNHKEEIPNPDTPDLKCLTCNGIGKVERKRK